MTSENNPPEDEKLQLLAASAQAKKAVGPLLKALQAASGPSAPKGNGTDKGKGI